MSQQEVRTITLVSAVGDALLNRGPECSVGQLVADLEGDGTRHGNDPRHVWDRHFYLDVKNVGGWPEEPRDVEKTAELLEAFETYLDQNPDKNFCETVCNAHLIENGLGDFDPDDTHYQSPISDLTDEQLLDYLNGKLEDGETVDETE